MMKLYPWRDVVSHEGPREGRGGILGPATSRRLRWWELTLSCGHEVERNVRYKPIGNPRGGTQGRSLSDVLPAPKRIRCDSCRTLDRSPG